MTEAGLEHEPIHIASFDETLISARRMGAADGVPLLLCNAVGATFAIFRRAMIDIAPERPVVTWDHRGLHGSGLPASERIDPGAHAEDAIAALEHFGFDEMVVLGWSNGCRIALELGRRYPERVRALTLVCGGYGHPLGRVLRRAELSHLLPSVVGVAKHFAGAIQGPFRAVISRPELAGLVRQSGFIGPTADIHALVEVLRGMADCDLKRLLATYEAVSGDADPELLRAIEAPVLLVGGERDAFTPLRMLEEMERTIAGARLITYERATHYLPIEYPARLSEDVRKFLATLAPL